MNTMNPMKLTPQFPPLLAGMAAGPANPFVVACDQARKGVDPGLLVWSVGSERLRAALVLTPETPLREAMAGFAAAAVGLQNALGALAPAETAVQFDWPDGIRINGGLAGCLRAAASHQDPGEMPDWLMVGFDLTLELPADFEPGETPDHTALYLENCRDLCPVELLEAWARHTLVWITDLQEPQGRQSLHGEWQGLIRGKGKTLPLPFAPGQSGEIIGFDENFGLLVKTDHETRLIPLSDILEKR